MDRENKGNTFTSRLKELALEDPGKPAYIFWDKNLKRTVLTRQDVWDKSRKCAAFFRRHGIVKGDVVCNTLVNSQERLITMYGALLAGAVSMHGQKLLADGQDILKNMEDAQCKCVLIDPDEEKSVDTILEKIKITDDKTGKIRYQGLPNLRTVIPIVRVKWLQILDEEQEMYFDDAITEDDIALIMVTSGSTGFGKALSHTHRSLAITGGNIKETVYLNQDSMHLNEESLGWIGGAPIMYPFIGLTRVLVDHWASGSVADYGALLLHVLEQEACDTALINPFTIDAMLKHLDSVKKQKIQKLVRAIGTGGGPISKSTMKAIGRICESVSVLYGATEIDIIYAINVTEPSEYEHACCGYPVYYGEAKIVDKDLQEVPQGKSGEVLLRGPGLFQQYLNNPEANKKALLADGWWRSSDIGHFNKKGQLFVYCRKSHVINYKGKMCNPGWLEARLNKHPHIEKCFVIGIPHPVEFEEVCLCISKTPKANLTAEEVWAYCKTLFLTTDTEIITPIPKHVLFFDSFPHKNNIKIDRKALKTLARRRVEILPCSNKGPRL